MMNRILEGKIRMLLAPALLFFLVNCGNNDVQYGSGIPEPEEDAKPENPEQTASEIPPELETEDNPGVDVEVLKETEEVIEESNSVPEARDSTATVFKNSTINLQMSAYDKDGDALAYEILKSPDHGELQGFDPTSNVVTYIPDPDFTGEDSVEFAVHDQESSSHSARISISVIDENTAPSFRSNPLRLHLISEAPTDRLDLKAVVRDFSDQHSDFENPSATGHVTGIVKNRLGQDHKPVYAKPNSFDAIADKSSFDQWFTDTPGVNCRKEISLPLKLENGLYRYENTNFFPIDNQCFGNEGRDHNFHYTMEIASSFTYQGTEVFEFSGDDDLWVFINGQLAIDVGGTHPALTESIDLRDFEDELDIEPGQVYSFHLFFAERKTTQSNFIITTGLKLNNDRAYEYQVEVDDPEGHAVTFELVEAPKGMKIDKRTGLITWKAANGLLEGQAEKAFAVIVEATDEVGASSRQEFEITLKTKSKN